MNICKMGWHRYKLVRDTGKHRYRECRVCGKRMIEEVSPGYGYQPIDRQWLSGGEWFDPTHASFTPLQRDGPAT